MESAFYLRFLEVLIWNRLVQCVLWIGGGGLWLISLPSILPPSDSLNPPLSLEQTQIDGHTRFAWIDGQKVQTGQLLQVGQSVYRVQEIEPGAAMLRQGGRSFQLELPKPGSVAKGQPRTSEAGW